MNDLKKLITQTLNITKTNDTEYIRQVIKIIHDYFNPVKHYVMTTKNLRLSRNASINFIIQNRLRTCGSLSYIAAVLLRKLGYKVQLVHGKRKIDGHWSHHAWIEVQLKGKWQPFDLFAKNFNLDDFNLDTKKNKKISTHQSWKELKIK